MKAFRVFTSWVKREAKLRRTRKRGEFGDQPMLLPIDIDPEPVEEKLTAFGGRQDRWPSSTQQLGGVVSSAKADREPF